MTLLTRFAAIGKTESARPTKAFLRHSDHNRAREENVR